MKSQMTFLYLNNMEGAHYFFENIIEFQLVFDLGWAKMYRVAGDAFEIQCFEDERSRHCLKGYRDVI